MSLLPVTPAGFGGLSHIDVPLAALPIGDFLIEVTRQGRRRADRHARRDPSDPVRSLRAIRWRGALIAVIALAVCRCGRGAVRGRYREGSFAPRYAPPRMPDGDFTICRLEYTRVVIEDMGVGWQTDYPFSERNLMTRLSELTKTPHQPGRAQRAEHVGGARDRSAALQLSVHRGVRCGHDWTEARGSAGPSRLPAQGRLPLGGRFLGDRRLGAVVERNRPRASAGRVSDHGRPADRSAASEPVHRDRDSADHEHPVLAELAEARTPRSAASTASSRICAPFAIITAASWC